MIARTASRCLLLALLAAGPVQAQTYSLAPAARVNGVAISTRTFEQAVQEYLREQQINIGSVRYPKRINEARTEVMDLLISKELVWQQANATGRVADAQRVDALLAEMRGQFSSENGFKARLAIDGFTEESYRDYLTRLATWQDYMEEVGARAVVTEQDIRAFYEQNRDKFMLPETRRARHILLKVPPGDAAAEQAARERMAAIESALRAGEDFALLATRYSEDSSAADGGDLGFFPRGKMVVPFDDALWALQPGQVSPAVKTVYGVHLIKLEQILPPHPVQLEQVQDQVRDYLMGVHRQREQERAIQALREQAEIEILAPL